MRVPLTVGIVPFAESEDVWARNSSRTSKRSSPVKMDTSERERFRATWPWKIDTERVQGVMVEGGDEIVCYFVLLLPTGGVRTSPALQTCNVM